MQMLLGYFQAYEVVLHLSLEASLQYLEAILTVETLVKYLICSWSTTMAIQVAIFIKCFRGTGSG